MFLFYADLHKSPFLLDQVSHKVEIVSFGGNNQTLTIFMIVLSNLSFIIISQKRLTMSEPYISYPQ